MTIELRDTVIIDVPADTVWTWLEAMPDHYLAWHPGHVSCRWLRGDGLVPGAVMEVVERLHGKKHRLRLRLTGVERGRRFDYRIFPGLGGSFRLEPDGAGTCLTATIVMGVDTPILGRVVDALLRWTIAARIEAIARHQAEEGRNLKALLESPSRSPK